MKRFGLLLTGVALTGCTRQSPAPPSPQPPVNPATAAPAVTPTLANTPFIVPGVRTPETFAAATVTLPDDASVIGIVRNGQPRAYLCQAMASMMSHVVNDRVADSAVSITFCDRTQCIRVFDGAGAEPLELQTGGFMNGEMVLRLGGTMYAQSDPSLPLPEGEFQRTTWGAWKSEYPETTVYLGGQKSAYVKIVPEETTVDVPETEADTPVSPR